MCWGIKISPQIFPRNEPAVRGRPGLRKEGANRGESGGPPGREIHRDHDRLPLIFCLAMISSVRIRSLKASLRLAFSMGRAASVLSVQRRHR